MTLTLTAPPKRPTAKDYAALLFLFRRRQLEIAAGELDSIAGVFDAAMTSITDTLAALPAGDAPRTAEWLTAHLRALRTVDDTLTGLRRDYGSALASAMLASAQVMVDRQAAIEEDLGESSRLDGVADGAVEDATGKVYRDGMALAARLNSLDAQTRAAVQAIIAAGLVNRSSGAQMAAELTDLLAHVGPMNPRFRAMLIARNEIQAATRFAVMRAATDPVTGEMKRYMEALTWTLSLSHSEQDICDVYAETDNGLGPGNFLPMDVPDSHPNCKCSLEPVLVGVDA